MSMQTDIDPDTEEPICLRGRIKFTSINQSIQQLKEVHCCIQASPNDFHRHLLEAACMQQRPATFTSSVNSLTNDQKKAAAKSRKVEDHVEYEEQKARLQDELELQARIYGRARLDVEIGTDEDISIANDIDDAEQLETIEYPKSTNEIDCIIDENVLNIEDEEWMSFTGNVFCSMDEIEHWRRLRVNSNADEKFFNNNIGDAEYDEMDFKGDDNRKASQKNIHKGTSDVHHSKDENSIEMKTVSQVELQSKNGQEISKPDQEIKAPIEIGRGERLKESKRKDEHHKSIHNTDSIEDFEAERSISKNKDEQKSYPNKKDDKKSASKSKKRKHKPDTKFQSKNESDSRIKGGFENNTYTSSQIVSEDGRTKIKIKRHLNLEELHENSATEGHSSSNQKIQTRQSRPKPKKSKGNNNTKKKLNAGNAQINSPQPKPNAE